MGLLDGFGVLDSEFGGRSDVPTLDFGIIPGLMDEKDEYRKTDNEIQGALIEASEMWIPANRTGRIRARLGTFAYLSYVGGQSTEYSILVWRPEDLEPTEDSSNDFGGFGWVAQTAAIKENQLIFFVMGHDSTGHRNPNTGVDITINSGVHAGSYATQSNRPTIFFDLDYLDASAVQRGAQAFLRLIGDSNVAGSLDAIDFQAVAIVHSFRRGISGDDVLATGVVTVLDMDDDTGTGGHDDFPGAMSGTGTFTIPAEWAGKWEFFAGAQYASNVTGVRVLQIQLNGGGVADMRVGAIGTNVLTCATGPINVVAGDTVRVVGQQTSGGNLNVADTDLTFFGGRYVGNV